MKRLDQERIDSMARRNTSDLRMVGGIVGVFTGGFVALVAMARLLRHIHHVPAWLWLVIPFVGAIIGGAIGYFKDTWRSGL